uniref:Putative ixodes 8-cys protein n=1 Tax=Ixodes ricinus TaxID=34613 RepID=A0A0K8RLX5_IXORI
MLKVRFCIFLASAALCFGEGSEGGSDTEGEGSETEASSGTGTRENEEGAESTGVKTTNKPLNLSFPAFVGDYEKQKSLASSLFTLCTTQKQ